MEQKLQKLFLECVNELNKIGIDILNEKQYGKIEISISKRNNKRYGCCKQEEPDKNYRIITKMGRRKVVKYERFNKHHIEISKWVMELENNVIKNTIMHELIHCMPYCNNHGTEFKKYANMINIHYNYGMKYNEICGFLMQGQFSTYYINMSIFLAYALTFTNAEVLLMFLIPVKVKWLGIVYGVMLALQMVECLSQGILLWPSVAAIAASLINFLIFWLRNGNHVHLGAKQRKRRAEFKQDIRRNPKITKHKCAICGQTEDSNPGLEFRFCSKCNGNYEYCQQHLFTHEHVK